MLAFLNALLDQGLALVSLGDATPASLQEMEPVFLEMDGRRRLQLPHEAPTLDMPAAAWAAGIAYEAARLLVARDVDEAGVAEAFAEAFPYLRHPGSDYSVDLVLCHLPDLHRLAVRLSPGDPLVGQFLRLGETWPLSSVGMDGVKPGPLASFIDHPSLRQLYVDRILETKDFSRLDDPRVQAAVQEALGAYPELCEGAAGKGGLIQDSHDEPGL